MLTRLQTIFVFVCALMLSPVATAQWNPGCLNVDTEACASAPGSENFPEFNGNMDQLIDDYMGMFGNAHPEGGPNAMRACLDHCAAAWRIMAAACSGTLSFPVTEESCMSVADEVLQQCMIQCGTGDHPGY